MICAIIYEINKIVGSFHVFLKFSNKTSVFYNLLSIARLNSIRISFIRWK
jgi:hypothetical protein